MLPLSLHADQKLGCPVIWRPWDLSTTETQVHKMVSGGLASAGVFHHPVRLFLPRSRMQEYLSHLGTKVLTSFPTQATLHFYNDDDSSSEEEDDDDDGQTNTYHRLMSLCELSSEP